MQESESTARRVKDVEDFYQLKLSATLEVGAERRNKDEKARTDDSTTREFAGTPTGIERGDVCRRG